MTKTPTEGRRVDVVRRQRVFDGFFKLDQAVVRHETEAGEMSEPSTVLTLERGDSVAALVHAVDEGRLLLTEQFRFPTYAKGPGWLLEPAAGILEEGEDPAEAMAREMREELGVRAAALTPLGCVYLSPGGSSERAHLFYAAVRSADLEPGQRFGVAEEAEHVTRRALRPAELFRMLDLGEIADAKLMILAQWLRRHLGAGGVGRAPTPRRKRRAIRSPRKGAAALKRPSDGS